MVKSIARSVFGGSARPVDLEVKEGRAARGAAEFVAARAPVSDYSAVGAYGAIERARALGFVVQQIVIILTFVALTSRVRTELAPRVARHAGPVCAAGDRVYVLPYSPC